MSERVHVLSTGLPNTLARVEAKVRCLRSVCAQSLACTHEYIDATDQMPCKSSIQNEYEAFARLAPSDIVVLLDGDDELAHPHVLQFVADLYGAEPSLWLTYGSFVCQSGKPGWASEYTHDEYRADSSWRASHLKTFRAGLAQQLIPERDLMSKDGRWRELAVDHALMFPMLEMSGLAHQRFVPEILYVYNDETCWEAKATEEEKRIEYGQALEIRANRPLKPLTPNEADRAGLRFGP